MLRIKTIKFIFSCLFLVFLWICFVSFKILHASCSNKINKADVIIVLGAAAYGTEPSPVLRARILQAVDLYKQNLATNIIFTGGNVIDSDLTEAQVSKKLALKLGVVETDIWTEDLSKNTLQNLVYAQTIMTLNNFNSAIIVSDPLHLSRAQRIADDIDLKASTFGAKETRFKTLKTQIPFFIKEFLLFHRDLFHNYKDNIKDL